ncbi:MAG: diguanylate cyclase [Candidatus Limnocylindrales bacterium]
MSLDQLRTLLLIAVSANVVLFLALALPALAGRRSLLGSDDPDLLLPPEPTDIALDIATAQGDAPPELAGLPSATYERAVRVVSYGFLLSAAAAVALSGAWPATASAIYALLGLGALFVLLVHDLLPAGLLGAGKFVLEGMAAIALVTLLVALTGGAASPFVLGYFLIAGGAALVVDARPNLLLAAAISLVYLVTVAGLPGTAQLDPTQAAGLAVVLVAFWLFSYLASVVARAQRATRDAAVRLSLHDPLTRLYNRSYFFAVMEREFQRARRTGRGFCLLLLDLDGLKPINDTFGHPMGDRVLRAVGEVIGRGIRGIDTAARYGGDKFVVLLPETELAGALTLAEKLRDGVGEIRLGTDTWQVPATVSIGVASFPDDGATPQALLERADAAMFGSKRGGRDRVGTVGSLVDVLSGVAAPSPRPLQAPPARSRPALSRAAGSRPTTIHAAPAVTPAHLRFGGTRADSVLAALTARGRARVTSPAAAPVGTRAISSVAAPAVSGSPRRAARARSPLRSGPRAEPGASSGARPATDKGSPPTRRRLERRFEVMHHDDDAQIARTMRTFIGGDGAPGEGRLDDLPPDVRDRSA